MSKFETNGAILKLKNGKTISVRKSWIDNSKVYCLVNQILTPYSFEEIESIHSYVSMKKKEELKVPDKKKKFIQQGNDF